MFIFSRFSYDALYFFTLNVINLGGRGKHRAAMGLLAGNSWMNRKCDFPLCLNSWLSGFWEWIELGQVTGDESCNIQRGMNAVLHNQTRSKPEILPIINKSHIIGCKPPWEPAIEWWYENKHIVTGQIEKGSRETYWVWNHFYIITHILNFNFSGIQMV